MHTTTIDGWVFVYDGDPRGSVVRVTTPHGIHFMVPYDVLEEFVGRVLTIEHVSVIENLTGTEFLRGRKHGEGK